MSSAAAMLRDEFTEQGWRINPPEINDELVSRLKISNSVMVPIWMFSDGEESILCDRAVEVEIRSVGESYFASCERLHVFSQGSSHSECLKDLHRQVLYFFNDYSSIGEDDVVGLAKELRDLYVAHFRGR